MSDYIKFKNRSINITKKVMVYKNLHNGMLSVKQDGLVVAHVEAITLSPAMFKVNESGRQRVIKEKKKNVHAYVVGYVDDINVTLDVNDSTPVSYNPYKFSYFYEKTTQKPVSQLGHNVHCSSTSGLYIINN